MPSNRPRLLIADDDTLVAELCRKLLKTDYEEVGTVNDGLAMVRVAAEMKPDIIRVDIGLQSGPSASTLCQSTKSFVQDKLQLHPC